tara:strand:+ start:131 stop:2200 length:2070 start_codon:yes stop_codon:yes gene_type:complete
MSSKFTEAINFHKKGDLLNANNILLEILKESPKDVDVLHLLGIIAFQTRRYKQSIEYINKAINVNKNIPELYKNLSIVYKEINEHDYALKYCDEAIKLNPNYAEAYNNKGHILISKKQHTLAIENWEKALQIKPDYAEVLNNLGNVYTQIDKINTALDYYNKSIKLNPNFPNVYINRAYILKDLKKYDLALEDCNRAIKLKPDFAEAYNNKAIILREMKNMENAYENYMKAYEIKPDLEFLIGSLMYTKLNLGIWNDFEKNVKSIEGKIIKGEIAIHPFSSLLLYDSPDLQKISSEVFLKKNYKSKLKGKIFDKKNNNKKIHIGYYSSDFCLHPVSCLIANLLELHDKSQFELFGFYFGPDKNDEMLKRISRTFNNFYDVRNKTDKEITELSKKLNIDIAIDLMTYTEKNRFGIFIEKCAPIQVNFLGYPGTSAANCIDYIVADKILIPPENQKNYSEKIIYLPDTYQPNDSNKKISDKIFTKDQLKLPENNFIFCCFNKNQKINPRIFTIWINILKKVNNSVLWLLEENQTFVNNIKKECDKKNINSERIIFAKRMNLSDHLARHKLADLFLDTIPYGAHTTCSDALWAGLPVLTKIGSTFASRVSASLLKAINLDELITNSEKDYENLAVEFALNPKKLSNIKKKLSINIGKEPLFNTKLFTKNIESAYKQIYQRYKNNLPTTNIEI